MEIPSHIQRLIIQYIDINTVLLESKHSDGIVADTCTILSLSNKYSITNLALVSKKWFQYVSSLITSLNIETVTVTRVENQQIVKIRLCSSTPIDGKHYDKTRTLYSIKVLDSPHSIVKLSNIQSVKIQSCVPKFKKCILPLLVNINRLGVAVYLEGEDGLEDIESLQQEGLVENLEVIPMFAFEVESVERLESLSLHKQILYVTPTLPEFSDWEYYLDHAKKLNPKSIYINFINGDNPDSFHWEYSRFSEIPSIESIVIDEDMVELLDIIKFLSNSNIKHLNCSTPLHLYSMALQYHHQQQQQPTSNNQNINNVIFKENECDNFCGLPICSLDKHSIMEQFKEFCDKLSSTKTLERLELANFCHSGKHDRQHPSGRPNTYFIDCFAKVLEENKSLRELKLSDLQIIDNRFFESLAVNTTLTSLSLTNGMVESDEMMKQLCEALSQNHHVTNLSVSNSPSLTSQCDQYISNMLRANSTTLVILDISSCKFTSKSVQDGIYPKGSIQYLIVSKGMKSDFEQIAPWNTISSTLCVVPDFFSMTLKTYK